MEFDQSGVDALMEITARPELVFVRGEGSWLDDHAGKRYLDMVQGWAGGQAGALYLGKNTSLLSLYTLTTLCPQPPLLNPKSPGSKGLVHAGLRPNPAQPA